MINFGLLNTNQNPMQDFAKGSAYATELMKNQNAYNVQSALYDLSRKENPTYEDYDSLMKNYPQLAEVVQLPMANITEQRRKAAITQLSPIVAAIQNGRGDKAAMLMDDSIAAYENSGDTQNAEALRTMRKAYDIDPQSIGTTATLMLSGLAPDITKQLLNERKIRYEEMVAAADVQSKMATAQQNLAQGNLYERQASVVVPKAQSEIDQNIAQTQASLASADEQRTKAALMPMELQQKQRERQSAIEQEYLKEARQYGDASLLAQEKAREIQGTIDLLADESKNWSSATTMQSLYDWWQNNPNANRVRESYNELRASKAIANLPKGAASDADVALALKGVPVENLRPEQMMSFLRGVQKMYQIKEKQDEYKSQWIQNFGALTPAKRSMNIGGVLVQAGTTPQEFMRSMTIPLGTSIEAARTPKEQVLRNAIPSATSEDVTSFLKSRRSSFEHGGD